jgi:hypothetical protein
MNKPDRSVVKQNLGHPRSRPILPKRRPFLPPLARSIIIRICESTGPVVAGGPSKVDIDVTMESCTECGLPKTICAALAIYQKALSAYEKGNFHEAHHRADEATDLVQQYKKRHGSLKPIDLSDSERLRLSGYF